MRMTLEPAFFSSPYDKCVTTCGCVSVLYRKDRVPWVGGANADVFLQPLTEDSICRHRGQVAATWQPRALRLPTPGSCLSAGGGGGGGPAQRRARSGEGHAPATKSHRFCRPHVSALFRVPGLGHNLPPLRRPQPVCPGWPVCPACESPGPAVQGQVRQGCPRRFLQGDHLSLFSVSFTRKF